MYVHARVKEKNQSRAVALRTSASKDDHSSMTESSPAIMSKWVQEIKRVLTGRILLTHNKYEIIGGNKGDLISQMESLEEDKITLS